MNKWNWNVMQPAWPCTEMFNNDKIKWKMSYGSGSKRKGEERCGITCSTWAEVEAAAEAEAEAVVAQSIDVDEALSVAPTGVVAANNKSSSKSNFIFLPISLQSVR